MYKRQSNLQSFRLRKTSFARRRGWVRARREAVAVVGASIWNHLAGEAVCAEVILCHKHKIKAALSEQNSHQRILRVCGRSDKAARHTCLVIPCAATAPLPLPSPPIPIPTSPRSLPHKQHPLNPKASPSHLPIPQKTIVKSPILAYNKYNRKGFPRIFSINMSQIHPIKKGGTA